MSQSVSAGLTLHAEQLLIADGFALGIDGTAGVISGRLFRHLLQHQALAALDDPGGCIELQQDVLCYKQKMKKENGIRSANGPKRCQTVIGARRCDDYPSH